MRTEDGNEWEDASTYRTVKLCELSCLHISFFRCVDWRRKKGLFIIHRISYCSLFNRTSSKPDMKNVWGLPGQLDLNLHFITAEFKIWYGINQVHVLITSLTINPCCTCVLVQMSYFLICQPRDVVSYNLVSQLWGQMRLLKVPVAPVAFTASVPVNIISL